MTPLYRICPTNKLVIEWKRTPTDTHWGFYKVCDSPADAKRAIAVLVGDAPLQQADFLEAL